ncbi:MAG: TIGR00304 family membrane protein [Candidatus Thorarchaeota archaeon]
MQTSILLQNLGWILLLLGILFVCIYAFSSVGESISEDSESRTQSKGIIFLGPIPIVWGYGKKGWMIAGIIAIILMFLWIVFFL